MLLITYQFRIYAGHGLITIHGNAPWRPQPAQRQALHVPASTGARLLPSEESFTQVHMYCKSTLRADF